MAPSVVLCPAVTRLHLALAAVRARLVSTHRPPDLRGRLSAAGACDPCSHRPYTSLHRRYPCAGVAGAVVLSPGRLSLAVALLRRLTMAASRPQRGTPAGQDGKATLLAVAWSTLTTGSPLYFVQRPVRLSFRLPPPYSTLSGSTLLRRPPLPSPLHSSFFPVPPNSPRLIPPLNMEAIRRRSTKRPASLPHPLLPPLPPLHKKATKEGRPVKHSSALRIGSALRGPVAFTRFDDEEVLSAAARRSSWRPSAGPAAGALVFEQMGQRSLNLMQAAISETRAALCDAEETKDDAVLVDDYLGKRPSSAVADWSVEDVRIHAYGVLVKSTAIHKRCESILSMLIKARKLRKSDR